MENDNFKDVQKNDIKRAWGFYLFCLALLIWGTVWLLQGGAEDGAWWMIGLGGGLLLINAGMNWLTRPKPRG
ncbi:hypothetical protein [Hymenobacter rubripertinctus]|uniref:2TM domain-containing protein n=1 Tax=Hymenobacter rubripertinctus TaxID=2029981 RepID=A0A418QMV9_9BACT|nr:hypothetical protein [Hymenobacter rubripertinctus]RIY06484.1 hypothetical protein D0T11_18765 [Hymenobacter rubripertinctus]